MANNFNIGKVCLQLKNKRVCEYDAVLASICALTETLTEKWFEIVTLSIFILFSRMIPGSSGRRFSSAIFLPGIWKMISVDLLSTEVVRYSP